ncbi:DNA/RNA non-specific endonuclease [Streptomyces sp. NPDC001739]
MLASLVYVLWPSGSGSHGEASGPHVSPAHRGALAARALNALPAVNMSAAYAPVEHAPVTHADLTVTASGQASGTLSEPVAGKSAMAWSGDQLYLKGDSHFWAQQDPLYGRDLTSTGHWVAPKKRSGYYMLDRFAVNAGSLTPKSLASAVRQVTSDPEVVEQNAGTIGGRKAVSYAAQGWTVVLAADSPYTVLAIGGDPSHQSPVKPAAWHTPRRTKGRAELVDYRATATPAAYGDGDYSSYLLMVPKPATAEQATAVRSTATSAAATAVAPATSSEVVSKSMGPNFTITNNSGYLCTTNPCSYSFTVTNSGDEAGAATLYLSLPRVPDQPHPLGTLQPKQSKSVSGSRPNIAVGTGRTVKHTDYAWVYSSAEYGSDPKVGSRLHARNLRPGDVSVGTPLKPTVAKLLDLMTKDRPTSDTAAGDKALDVLKDANDQGELPALGTIADSHRMENPEALRENLPTTDKVENQRVLQQVAQLLGTDPQAKVTWAGPYKVGDKTYRADYFYTTTRQGQKIKRAVRAKTVQSPGQLGPQMSLGAEQLNGERQGSANAGSEKAPPGFERVLQINVEPGVGPVLALSTTTGLEQLLSTGQEFGQARESLCEPNGGGPRVDRLVIVNESGTHEWTDLRRLGMRCTGTGAAPASPSPSGSGTPDDKQTCPPQRPTNGVVKSSSTGWTYYTPTGSHKRAIATTASTCLDPTWGGRVKFLRDGQGRLHEMNATLTRDMLDKGTEANQRLRPPGFSGGAHNQARGHLLANRLGGSGDTLDNLFTITQNPTNSPKMRDDEAKIYDAVAAGEKVTYNVYLEYANNNAKIPKYIQLDAVGDRGFSLDVVLENPAYKQE